jgi:phenylpyruvate tautomerase PptA (4-oxalocrotonate tautomerase family)
MPSILIETRQPYPPGQENAIMTAVHGALRAGFKIKSNDRNVRLVTHEPHRFLCPPDKEKPERYTHISIDAFAGRSLSAKRALYKAIVDSLEPLGIPKDHVNIVLREAPASDWGIRGGQAACDVDLGFNVNV